MAINAPTNLLTICQMTYSFCFKKKQENIINRILKQKNIEVEAKNRVEAEEKAKEYVDKYQADKFFECATNRVFKIIPTIEGDKE